MSLPAIESIDMVSGGEPAAVARQAGQLAMGEVIDFPVPDMAPGMEATLAFYTWMKRVNQGPDALCAVAAYQHDADGRSYVGPAGDKRYI